MTNQPVKSNPLQAFMNEEQDPNAVAVIHEKVTQILTRGEEIIYIAVQKKPAVNLSPDAVVLTNRRVIIYRPKMLGGVNFEDCIWRDIADAHLDEGILGAKITFKTIQNRIAMMDYLPKAQARKLYSYAQEMEEAVREERRTREMEEKRAAAGGIVFQGGMPMMQSAPAPAAPVAAKEDPVAILQRLKAMLDAELITKEEYDAKKVEILSRM